MVRNFWLSSRQPHPKHDAIRWSKSQLHFSDGQLLSTSCPWSRWPHSTVWDSITLPPYSPDLNPAEEALSYIKGYLKKAWYPTAMWSQPGRHYPSWIWFSYCNTVPIMDNTLWICIIINLMSQNFEFAYANMSLTAPNNIRTLVLRCFLFGDQFWWMAHSLLGSSDISFKIVPFRSSYNSCHFISWSMYCVRTPTRLVGLSAWLKVDGVTDVTSTVCLLSKKKVDRVGLPLSYACPCWSCGPMHSGVQLCT